MKIGRNEPCPCGSGKKYKACCELAKAAGKGDWSRKGLWIAGAVLLFGATALAVEVVDAGGIAADGRVWSAEHGHWHNADGTEMRTGGSVPQPAGEIPAGKVWSPEHGRWHDAEGATAE